MTGPFFHPWLMAGDKGFMFAVVAFMERDVVWSSEGGSVDVRDCGVVACSVDKGKWFDNFNLQWDKFNVSKEKLESYTEEWACRKLIVGVFSLAK